MIFSEKNKYLYIGLPLSGSTSISYELLNNYDGKTIYYKHSNVNMLTSKEFKKVKDYLFFTVARDPISLEFTMYNKFLQNFKDQFTNPDRFIENGGYVSKNDRKVYHKIKNEGLSFEDYLLYNYKIRPYNNLFSMNSKYLNHVISFENLNADFEEIIRLLELDFHGELNKVNTTSKISQIPKLNPALVKKIFSPFVHFHKDFFNNYNQYPKPSLWSKLFFVFYNFVWKIRRNYIEKRYLNKSENNKLIYWG